MIFKTFEHDGETLVAIDRGTCYRGVSSNPEYAAVIEVKNFSENTGRHLSSLVKNGIIVGIISKTSLKSVTLSQLSKEISLLDKEAQCPTEM